jgi:transposase
MERIGLEAGPLSQWLHAGMVKAGLSVELIETRHVRAAFKTMPVKTDNKDARGIAQLMRLGWFRPVHCKSLAAQEVRALLTARKLIQGKLHNIEMSIRGILRGFGLKVGPTTRRTYAGRIRALIAGHSTLEAIATALLKVRDALVHEFAGFERKLRAIARQGVFLAQCCILLAKLRVLGAKLRDFCGELPDLTDQARHKRAQRIQR